MREADLIARIRKHFPRAGDDAAVIGSQVITNDMLIEDVDFTRAIPLRYIARKSLAVNLSDLAAMGAKPQYAIAALGIPQWVDANELIDDLAAAAVEQRIEIVGGDLSRAAQLILSITAIGEATRPLLRSGAKSGERIYVSRPLGASTAGLVLLQKGFGIDGSAPAGQTLTYAQREFAASAIRRQIDPEAEVALGLALAGIPQVTSCIDISDGLSTDLHHLCESSHLGREHRARAHSGVSRSSPGERSTRHRRAEGGASRRRGVRAALHLFAAGIGAQRAGGTAGLRDRAHERRARCAARRRAAGSARLGSLRLTRIGEGADPAPHSRAPSYAFLRSAKLEATARRNALTPRVVRTAWARLQLRIMVTE